MPPLRDPTPDRDLKLWGKVNIPLLGGVIAGDPAAPRAGSRAWSSSIHGVHVELQNVVRDLRPARVLAGLSLWPDAEGRCGPATSSAGADQARSPSSSPASSSASSRCWRCCRPGREGAFAPLVALVNHPDGSYQHRRLFLADRPALLLPRQRPDLSRLLRAGGRQCPRS